MRQKLFITLLVVGVVAAGTAVAMCARHHRGATTTQLQPVAVIGEEDAEDVTAPDPILRQVGLPVMPDSVPAILIERMAYTVSYNPTTRQPNWVMWCITPERIAGQAKRPPFYADMAVPAPRATNDDYRGSGWSRGHMCPAGDCKWSRAAMEESFALTNVCPQDASLNSGVWNSIEMKSRRWAERAGRAIVVAGPLFMRCEHAVIGPDSIPVPEAFFKVILLPGEPPRAVGYVCRNEKPGEKASHYRNTLRQVERITGYRFFTALPAASLDSIAMPE